MGCTCLFPHLRGSDLQHLPDGKQQRGRNSAKPGVWALNYGRERCWQKRGGCTCSGTSSRPQAPARPFQAPTAHRGHREAKAKCKRRGLVVPAGVPVVRGLGGVKTAGLSS